MPNTMSDCLRIMGFSITQNPTEAEVKSRYKQLAKRYHPDRATPGGESEG